MKKMLLLSFLLIGALGFAASGYYEGKNNKNLYLSEKPDFFVLETTWGIDANTKARTVNGNLKSIGKDKYSFEDEYSGCKVEITISNKSAVVKDNTCAGDVDFSDTYKMKRKLNSDDVEYIEFMKE